MNGFEHSPAVEFGLAQVKKACAGRNAPDFTLERNPELPAQAYTLRRQDGRLQLAAGDEEGALHALLDLADSVESGGDFFPGERLHTPSVPYRGIKLNAPLDARAPSYTDCGDSAQENIAFMWEESFWQGLLDRMALQRYNALTIWNLCPFPVMTRVPEYPDAALEDVMISSFGRRDLPGAAVLHAGNEGKPGLRPADDH